MSPPWTLMGGAALAGLHLGHRATRDLDLFWRRRSELGELVREAEQWLHRAGLQVQVVQRAAAFARLRVADGTETVTVDLVAEPAPPLELEERAALGDFVVPVASRHELLVTKLCSLLGRSEIRDLQDVAALLEAGGDLRRAAEDAPRVDTGFSPLTLAWVLRGLAVEKLARMAGIEGEAAAELARFRDGLVAELVRLARPA